MATVESGPGINQEELRCQLAADLALVLMGLGALLICLTWPTAPSPFAPTVPLATLLMGLGWGVRTLVRARPILARHLLLWGLTSGLLVAMWLSSALWLPFLGLMLAFVGTILVSGGGMIATGMVAALAAWLTHSGARTYPLIELFITLASGTALAWQTVRTLYTALDWAWTMQERASHLLELARDRQGELSRTLKSLDLTTSILTRTQRELIVARKQEEEARVMKERFAANVSHELRTPLNLILGFSELMYLSPEVYGEAHWPATLRRDIYQVYRSSRHLTEMIDDVLDLSRFEMSGFTLNKEPTPLEPLLRDTLEIVEDLFRGQPVRLEAEIAQDLPTLEIDRTRIRQVLLNLLNNARRFTEEGVVRMVAKQTGGEVVISVRDTGPGIQAENLPRIFDEFYQVDRSLRRRHEGAGLGLAISKRFVEAHDGRIGVKSQVGIGSTFYFALPIPGQYVPVSHLKMIRPLEPSQPEPHPPILVVDSDPAVPDLIRRYIQGYEVIQVEEPDKLPEAVTLHHPRAVVWNAPPGAQDSCDGIAFAPAPLIRCSLPSRSWVANDLAVAACLTKPITAADLVREIERLGNIHDVLVIDDDRGFCQLVERMLEATGQAFAVRRAYDGNDGLLALRAQRPDLVLLDLIMPNVDGFQVLEEMRREPELADVLVVLLTATSYAEDALAQRSSQIVIHHPAGLNSAEVLGCLRAVVGVLEPHYDERSAPEEALLKQAT